LLSSPPLLKQFLVSSVLPNPTAIRINVTVTLLSYSIRRRCSQTWSSVLLRSFLLHLFFPSVPSGCPLKYDMILRVTCLAHHCHLGSLTVSPLFFQVNLGPFCPPQIYCRPLCAYGGLAAAMVEGICLFLPPCSCAAHRARSGGLPFGSFLGQTAAASSQNTHTLGLASSRHISVFFTRSFSPPLSVVPPPVALEALPSSR